MSSLLTFFFNSLNFGLFDSHYGVISQFLNSKGPVIKLELLHEQKNLCLMNAEMMEGVIAACGVHLPDQEL